MLVLGIKRARGAMSLICFDDIECRCEGGVLRGGACGWRREV